MRSHRLLALALAAAFALGAAQTVLPPFDQSYQLIDLGTAEPFVPPNLGGVVYLPNDNSAVFVGGNANSAAGALYRVPLNRNVAGQIVSASYSQANRTRSLAYNDGGVILTSDGRLIWAQYPLNRLAQSAAGGFTVEQFDRFSGELVAGLVSLQFVPAYIPAAAGTLKIMNWPAGEVYDLPFTLEDNFYVFGTPARVPIAALPGGPDGFIYVRAGSPGISVNSMIVCEWSAGNVVVYEVDANANPIPASRRVIVQGLSGALGAAFDPPTGDFVFSTFGGGNRLAILRGFARQDPDPPAECECPQAQVASDCGSVTVSSEGHCVCLKFSDQGTCRPPFGSTCPP
jgi:hypothetical protein